MLKKSSLVIDLAYKELGYVETGKNITKYSAYFEGTDFYNGSKGDGKTWGAEWCDIFVDYLFCNAYGMENARLMLYQPKKSCGAGCKYSAQYYRNNKAFDKNPKVGDQIFFGKVGNEYHTGLVVAVNDKVVTTIEGNSNNMVRKIAYRRDDSGIAGYGHPMFDDNMVVNLQGYQGTFPTLPKRGYFVINDRGVNVKRMQEFLKWFDNTLLPRYGCDGVFGRETLSAVISFETRNNITPDGKFGPVCLAKAKEIKK